ncbi:MAG: hypothetical protein R3F59_02725 [Myxococcota bacterium]
MAEPTVTTGTCTRAGRLVAVDLTPVGPRLRWAAGDTTRLSPPIAGLDALEELDCTGLDLDDLDVRLLGRLRVLRCADNRLRELDLVASPSLQVLDCARNQLMVLDLRNNPSLREVTCVDNGLGLLVLADPHPGDRLEVLDVSHNQLMVLDLGDRPRLRVARVAHNALARAWLGARPLRELDLSRNDLDRVSSPARRRSSACTSGATAFAACELPAPAALRELRFHGNYVAELDLRGAISLEVLDAHRNQPRRWPCPPSPRWSSSTWPTTA